jgi:hypothetical protein
MATLSLSVVSMRPSLQRALAAAAPGDSHVAAPFVVVEFSAEGWHVIPSI